MSRSTTGSSMVRRPRRRGRCDRDHIAACATLDALAREVVVAAVGADPYPARNKAAPALARRKEPVSLFERRGHQRDQAAGLVRAGMPAADSRGAADPGAR